MLTFAAAAETEMTLHQFSARIRAAVSKWETLIWELRRVPERPRRQTGDPAALRARLEAALAEAEQEVEAMRQSLAAEEGEAVEWRRRALLGMIQGRDDLARQAAERLREHRAIAREMAEELARLQAFASATREILAAATPPEPGTGP